MLIGFQLITALLILGSPFILAQWIRQRYALPAILLTVGVLLFSGAFVAQTVIFLLVPPVFLSNVLVGGILVGLVVAVTDIIARFIGYQHLVPTVVYRVQAILIGIGYALVPIVITGISLLLDSVSHLSPSNSADVNAGVALAESAIAVTSLIFHITLSWLVLQSFVRGQISWLFGAILWSGVVAGTQRFILNSSTEPLTANSLWWVSVGLVSLAILVIVQAPPNFRWQPETNDIENERVIE